MNKEEQFITNFRDLYNRMFGLIKRVSQQTLTLESDKQHI